MFNRKRIKRLEENIDFLSKKLQSSIIKNNITISVHGRLNELENENRMLYEHLKIEKFTCNKEGFKASETSSQKQ